MAADRRGREEAGDTQRRKKHGGFGGGEQWWWPGPLCPPLGGGGGATVETIWIPRSKGEMLEGWLSTQWVAWEREWDRHSKGLQPHPTPLLKSTLRDMLRPRAWAWKGTFWSTKNCWVGWRQTVPRNPCSLLDTHILCLCPGVASPHRALSHRTLLLNRPRWLRLPPTAAMTPGQGVSWGGEGIL